MRVWRTSRQLTYGAREDDESEQFLDSLLIDFRDLAGQGDFVIEASNSPDLSRAQARTLAEFHSAMNAHERRLGHLPGLGKTAVEQPRIGRSVVASSADGRSRDGLSSLIVVAAVRRLAADTLVYGVAPHAVPDRDEHTLGRRLPVTVLDSLGGSNPVVVFGHPPIVNTGDRFRRILGFYLHGVDRRRGTPCASNHPRADLGLLFVCKTLGTSVDRSDSDLVRLTVSRRFPLFTIADAARESARHFDEDARALADLLNVAVKVFLVGDRQLRQCDPVVRHYRTPG